MNDRLYHLVIKACNDCIDTCNSFITSILNCRDMIKRFEYIRQVRDCIDTCMFTISFLHRKSPYIEVACRVCADICEASAAMCRKLEEDYAIRCAAICQKTALACLHAASNPASA